MFNFLKHAWKPGPNHGTPWDPGDGLVILFDARKGKPGSMVGGYVTPRDFADLCKRFGFPDTASGGAE